MNFEEAVRKAQILGVEMAKLGFHLADNPYTHINPKLEGTWSDSYCKYCAMLGLSQLAKPCPEDAPAAGRKRARGGSDKQKELCPAG